MGGSCNRCYKIKPEVSGCRLQTHVEMISDPEISESHVKARGGVVVRIKGRRRRLLGANSLFPKTLISVSMPLLFGIRALIRAAQTSLPLSPQKCRHALAGPAPKRVTNCNGGVTNEMTRALHQENILVGYSAELTRGASSLLSTNLHVVKLIVCRHGRGQGRTRYIHGHIDMSCGLCSRS